MSPYDTHAEVDGILLVVDQNERELGSGIHRHSGQAENPFLQILSGGTF